MEYGALAPHLTNGLILVTLVRDKEKCQLASRAAIPAHDPSASGHCEPKKLSRKEAAKELVCLVEQNMKRKGLSEEEKNQTVDRLATFVRNLKKSSRKS
jgi:hypothetical protein